MRDCEACLFLSSFELKHFLYAYRNERSKCLDPRRVLAATHRAEVQTKSACPINVHQFVEPLEVRGVFELSHLRELQNQKSQLRYMGGVETYYIAGKLVCLVYFQN